MQIWQFFIVLRQPVDISVTVFSNPTKLTNYIFIIFVRMLWSCLMDWIVNLEVCCSSLSVVFFFVVAYLQGLVLWFDWVQIQNDWNLSWFTQRLDTVLPWRTISNSTSKQEDSRVSINYFHSISKLFTGFWQVLNNFLPYSFPLYWLINQNLTIVYVC